MPKAGAGTVKVGRPRRPHSPSEQLPELFGAQFLRFLPGLEASGQSETRVASEEDDEEEDEGSATLALSQEGPASPVVSGGRSSLYSAPVTSLQSASSLFTGRAVGSPSLESGVLPQNRSLDSLADRWETRFLRRTTRAITTMRDTRVLGVPVPYYALLLASLAFCVSSYTFASRSTHVVGGLTTVEPDLSTKKEPGALLRAPVPVSPTREDLTTSKHPRPRKAAKHRRHGRRRAVTKRRKIRRRSPRVHVPLRRHTTTTSTWTSEEPWDSTTWAEEPVWDLGPETVPTPEETTGATTHPTSSSTQPPPPPPPSTVTTTHPTSPPLPSTVTGGHSTPNETFLNSSGLYDYEEVFEYYYAYDDNHTSKSNAPRADRGPTDSIQIN